MTQAASSTGTDIAGWHGKLPVAGDFVTRRLHSVFVEAWDNWLSNGLTGLQERDAAHWREHYLASPPWRFVITQDFMPSPLNAVAWAGVIIPSIDRVGRYYPLTLVSRLNAIPASHREQAGLWSWLLQLEDLAVDAMQDDWSIEQLDAELLNLGSPDRVGPMLGQLNEDGPWTSFFDACLSSRAPSGDGRCVWYSGSGLQTNKLIVTERRDDSVVELWS